MMQIRLQTSIPEKPSIRTGLENCIQAALNAANPEYILDKHLEVSDDRIRIFSEEILLKSNQEGILISIGKASQAMSRAILKKFGYRIQRGICVVKDLEQTYPLPANIQVIQGSHPSPDENSCLAGQSIYEMLLKAPEDAFVLCAISGGASALVVQPFPGISLADYQRVTQLMLQHEYSITEINTVRKHIDQFKGGGLLKWIGKRKGASIILSDVISNDLSVIASGPTVPDESTYQYAISILKSGGHWSDVPDSIQYALLDGEAGKKPETLKPDEFENQQYQNIIIGSLQQSMTVAVNAASSYGWNATEMQPPLSGSLESIADRIMADIKQAKIANKEELLVYGGEGTVKISGNGKGGRNSHLTWLLAQKIRSIPGVTILTFASDGDDGNSKAAGAIADSSTCIRAEHLHLDLKYYGENADTSTFFSSLGDSIITGATGTNVNDLVFVFVENV